VLKWVFERCDGTGKAVETPIGYMPTVDAIDRSGIENIVSDADIKELLTVDKQGWLKNRLIKEHYAKFGNHLPAELSAELAELGKRLSKI
jgi:phosphoenolpyruvate carboxykinase (GTP)